MGNKIKENPEIIPLPKVPPVKPSAPEITPQPEKNEPSRKEPELPPNHNPEIKPIKEYNYF